MVRTFTRKEFYALVWSKPLTHLAKEFNLSDVALHKICRKHDIPNPPLGWWAKKAAGKKVEQIPLPRGKANAGPNVTISAGEVRQEPEAIASARENARVAMSVAATGEAQPNAVVERTASKLRKAKPVGEAGLVSASGPGLIKATIAPASIDRFEQALNAIAAACEVAGIQLVRGDAAAAFSCNNEVIAFSISEAVKREKHVLSDAEKAKEEASQKQQERRSFRNEWDSVFSFSRLRFPEWDYHPTGRLSFELEPGHLWHMAPRRSFRDAKIQRLETMASDIAVGIAVMAAAMKEDRRLREEEEQRRKEQKHRRELALRAQHVEERRGKALEALLEELAALDRLRRFVAALESQYDGQDEGRVGAFLGFARERLANREAALSARELQRRLEESRLFGGDDDHDFRLPPYFY